MKLKLAFALAVLMVLFTVSIALADDPLDCPGVPAPSVAYAQQILQNEPELYVVASKAGLPAVNVAMGKAQFDFCYGQSNGFDNQFVWANSYWTRAQMYAKLLGVDLPFQNSDGPNMTPEYLNRVSIFVRIWQLQ